MGRYFRVRRVGDVVLWQRVPQGLHTRLGQWHNLKEGEELRIPTVDTQLELKRAKASARYLRAAAKGCSTKATTSRCGACPPPKQIYNDGTALRPELSETVRRCRHGCDIVANVSVRVQLILNQLGKGTTLFLS